MTNKVGDNDPWAGLEDVKAAIERQEEMRKKNPPNKLAPEKMNFLLGVVKSKAEKEEKKKKDNE